MRPFAVFFLLCALLVTSPGWAQDVPTAEPPTADAIPPGCAADLIAVAEAIQAGGQ